MWQWTCRKTVRNPECRTTCSLQEVHLHFGKSIPENIYYIILIHTLAKLTEANLNVFTATPTVWLCDCEENLFWLNIVKSFLSACVPDYMEGQILNQTISYQYSTHRFCSWRHWEFPVLGSRSGSPEKYSPHCSCSRQASWSPADTAAHKAQLYCYWKENEEK